MNTKEKLQKALHELDVAEKSWNETKADSDLITVKKLEEEIASLRKQVLAEDADALAKSSEQNPEPPIDTTEGQQEPAETNTFKVPANVNDLKPMVSEHVLKVYGRDALSEMSDEEIASIYLEVLDEAKAQYEAKGDADAMDVVQGYVDVIHSELSSQEKEQEKTPESGTSTEPEGEVAENEQPQEPIAPADTENKAAESESKPKPTPTPEGKKKGGKGKKK